MGNFVTSIELFFQDNFSSGFTKAGMLLRGMKDNLEDFATRGKVFDDVATKLTIMTQSIQNVANMFGNIVDEPKKFAMEIEDSMATVNSILKDDISKNMQGMSISTVDAYKLINNEAINFSKSYSVGAKSFIDTTYTMISAGLDTQQSVAATSQSMLLAKATLGNATDAANLLADAYNNMGDKTKAPQEEFTRLSDILTTTQQIFKIANLNQLSEGLKYGIPTANAFGVSIEQLNSVIGQLNTSGLAGSMAGTSFSTMLAQMSKASKEIGFEIVTDSSGGMDLISTISNMKDRYSDLQQQIGNQGTADIFLKSFGQEAFKGVSNLITGFDSLTQSYAQVQSAGENAGATLDAYNKVTDTTSNRLQIIQNRKDALKIKMGELMKQTNIMGIGFNSIFLSMQEKLLDSRIGQGLAMLGMNVASIGKGFFTGTAQVMQFAASAMTVASLASKGGAVANLAGNFMKLGGSVIQTGRSFIMSIPAILGFNSSLNLCPAIWIISAIIAIGTAVFFIIKYWKPISEFFIRIFGHIKGAFNNLWNGILNNKLVRLALNIFTPFIGIPITIAKHWGIITPFFSKLWNGMLNNKLVQMAIMMFAPFIAFPIIIIKNWSKITGFFTSFWSGIKSLLNKVPNSFLVFIFPIGLIIKYWGLFSSIFVSIFKAIPSFFKNNVIQPFIMGNIMLFNFVKNVFIGIYNSIIKPFINANSFISDFIKNVFKKFKDFIPFFKEIFDSVFDFIMKPFEKIDKFIAGLFGKGKKVGETLSKGVNSDNSMKTSVEKKLEKTSKLFPKSDAKEGPFSTLTLSGKKIMSTLSTGVISENSLEKSIDNKFGNVNKSLPKNTGVVNNIKNINNNEKSNKSNPVINNIYLTANNLVGNVKEIQTIKDFCDTLMNMCGVTI